MEPLPKQLTLASFFSILWRQRYFMLAIVALSLVVGYLAYKRAKPVWESSMEFQVLGAGASSQNSNSSQGQVPTVTTPDMPTQIEILESPEFLGHLYVAGGFDPLPQYMSQADIDNLPSLRVEQNGATNTMRVYVDSADYTAAGVLGEQVPRVYSNYLKGIQEQSVASQIQFLKDRLNGHYDVNKHWVSGETEALKQAQKDLEAFKADRKGGLISIEGESAYRTQRVTSTQAALTAAQTAVAVAEDKLRTLQQQLASLPKSYQNDTKETNPQIDAEKQTIEQLKAQRQVDSITYSEGNPVLQRDDAQIKAHEAILAHLPKSKPQSSTTPYPMYLEYVGKVKDAQLALKESKLEEQRAADEATKAQNELNAYNKDALSQNDLEETVKDRQNAVLTTKHYLDQLQVQQSSITDPIDVLQQPTTPDKVKPKGVQYILLAFLMGLFAATGFALTKDSLEDRLSSAEEIYNLTGLPSLGELPSVSSRLPVLAEGISNSSVLEQYRVLRFNIKFSTLDQPVKSIVVTSSGPGEGKTELACNLAIAACGEGRRVILVDANLRNPMIHKKMNVPARPGLTDVVAGEAELEQSIYQTSIPGLRVLTSGSMIATPAELLASNQMRQVYDRLAADSDLVIFDAPSCIGFADTPILSNVADSVLYVARSGRTKRFAVRKGIDTLRQSNARILGVATSGTRAKTYRS